MSWTIRGASSFEDVGELLRPPDNRRWIDSPNEAKCPRTEDDKDGLSDADRVEGCDGVDSFESRRFILASVYVSGDAQLTFLNFCQGCCGNGETLELT